ncbi:MAG: hypothetical protein QOJ30_2450 [Pseudonocardiales bacterium]|nr:hypothetical protein [Pseudonocardiales bacterium]
MEKIVAVVTSRDVALSHPGTAATEEVAGAPGFDPLLETHELAWHQLWRRFRLDLTDGDSPATVPTLRTLRLSIFHVLQTVSPHTLDLDAGIPARGMHGEAYRGHVFWDELFVFPLLTLRIPGLARALLHYRVRRLNAARRAARGLGHRGAMFPWQSGSDGREESQQIHLNPLSGRWLPDVSHLQRRVGLAVAYNIWQYYQAAGDLEFLAEHGAEVLLEVARFFAGLAPRPGDGPLPHRRGDGTRRVLHPLSGRGRTWPRRQRLHQRDGGVDASPGRRRAVGAAALAADRARRTTGPDARRTAALERHHPADVRADRRGRRHQPVPRLPRPRRARSRRLPPAATAICNGSTGSWRPRAARWTTTRCPSRRTS